MQIPRTDRVSTLRLSGDVEADERTFDALAAQFGPEELETRGLSFFHLGMAALFGRDRGAEAVRALARDGLVQSVRAEWTLHSRARALGTALRDERPLRTPTFLRGWDAARIRAAAAGRGLILCNFHYGQHRLVVPDVARLGLDVVFPASSEQAHAQYFSEALELLGIEFLPVEDRRIGMRLVRALRRGKVVIINTDANSGADGPLGDQGRAVVSFAGRRLTVKAGIARLARALDVPILPVFASPYGLGAEGRRDGYDGTVELCEPLEPSDFGADDDADARIMQALYDLLGERVRRHPAYWEYARFAHRWMEPEPVETGPARPLPAVALHADGRVAVPFTKGARACALTDARDFTSFPAPAWCPGLIQALVRPSGLDAAWLDAQALSEAQRRAALDLLAALDRRRMLATTPDGGPEPAAAPLELDVAHP